MDAFKKFQYLWSDQTNENQAKTFIKNLTDSKPSASSQKQLSVGNEKMRHKSGNNWSKL